MQIISKKDIRIPLVWHSEDVMTEIQRVRFFLPLRGKGTDMAKLTIQELKKIKENASRDISLRQDKGSVKVTVHMGTCGIAAGAREVMSTLMDEISESGRHDIRVVTSGCMGMCSSEPNITVETDGAEPIIYQKVNTNIMRQIFRRHILLGEVQSDFALAKM